MLRINNNINKVNTKEELLNRLEKYRGILNKSTFNYLNSLVNLEISVIKDNIDNNRSILSEFEIYKKILIFNIYNRSLNIIKNNNLKITSNDEGFEGLKVLLDDLDIFEFNYENSYFISLYQIIEDIEQKEKEAIRIKDKLDKLYKEQNSFNKTNPAYSNWSYTQIRLIDQNKKLLRQLNNQNIDRNKITILNEIHNLFVNEFGLENSNFEEINLPKTKEKSENEKTLIKVLPGITIKNNIKYI